MECTGCVRQPVLLLFAGAALWGKGQPLREMRKMEYTGEKVLVVGGGTLQVPVVQAVQNLGHLAVVIDRDSGCPARRIAHAFERVDIYDPKGALAAARRHSVGGVVAVAIDAEDTAAYVAEQLGLPGPPYECAQVTRNKDHFYSLAGLQKYFPLHVAIPEGSQGVHVPFPPPWVVRPVDNSASRGTTLVHHREDLERALEVAYQNAVRRRVALVCEMLPEGREYSTEIMFIRGRPAYINTVRRYFWPRNLGFVEIGHLSPAPDPAIHSTLFEVCKEVAKELGVDWGVVKIDTLVAGDVVFILEACLRLSGGADSTHTYPLAYRKSSVKAFINLSLGKDPGPVEGRHHCYAAAVGFTLPEGVYKAPTPLELRYKLRVNDIIFRPEGGALRDCAGRAGFVIVTGKDPAETWRRGLEAAVAVPSFFRR